MTVRSRLPLPLRVLLGFLFLAVAAAVGAGLYEYGRDLTGPGRREMAVQLELERAQLREALADRDRLQAAASAFESQLKIERAAQSELSRQVSGLEIERNRLRDDLAFFESLLPTKAGASGVLIRSFRMQPEGGAGQWRYRLLVQQAGKAEADFAGTLQLQINLVQGSKPTTMQIPESTQGEDAKPFELSFRHYQRVEGVVTLPPGGTPRSVLVRILSAGRTMGQQSFPL